jgi:hypothetical protein
MPEPLFGANEALARRVARAFATSFVSIETKGAHLRFALAIYHLADALDQAT